MRRHLYICISVIVIVALMCGCRTQYVPVEVVKTETVHHHDTIHNKDSIRNEKETIIREARPEDSAMIARLGIKLQDNERLLILLQKELSEAMSNKYENHLKDSVRKESVQVPYPVPVQLSRWQSFCCDYGKIMLGGTVVMVVALIICVVIIIRKKRSN